ncbi:MAG TPA: alpha/beta hydrolase [Ktedonobacteraceae bacterium]|jgi:pimeloyl-ACP methyl ester carboxylesterase|nr:alpha/beta hydrolase [Ktedonobacteraceae bacterium]
MTVAAQQGFAEVNRTRLYYEVAGSGHPLVLIHGGLMDNTMWDEQFAAFAQCYRTIRYDIRAFGQSDLPTGSEPYSMYEDLHALLKFLGVEKTYMLGLSMGGSIAIDFTLAHPEMVDALVLVGPGLNGYDFTPGDMAPLFEEEEAAYERGDFEQASELENRIWVDGRGRTPEQVNPAVRKHVYDMNLHNYQRMAGKDLPEPQKLEPLANTRLGEIRVPTLIIVGDRDVQAIQDIVDILAKEIPGAQKVVMRDTAHVPNMEKPDEFNRIVLDFLQSL